MAMDSTVPNRRISRVSGVSNRCTSLIMVLIRPSSVFGPVALTTPIPWPAVTMVPE